MVPVHDYVKRYAKAFAITKIRTFTHEPFFIVGGGGGGAYSWYFTVHVHVCAIHVNNAYMYMYESNLRSFVPH